MQATIDDLFNDYMGQAGKPAPDLAHQKRVRPKVTKNGIPLANSNADQGIAEIFDEWLDAQDPEVVEQVTMHIMNLTGAVHNLGLVSAKALLVRVYLFVDKKAPITLEEILEKLAQETRLDID